MNPIALPRIARSLRIPVAVSIFLLVATIGIAIQLLVIGSRLDRQAADGSRGILDEIEKMVDQASDAATQTLTLAGQPCSRAVLRLREEVQSRPYVRSANLVDPEGVLYCSSLVGDVHEATDPNTFANGTLELLPFNRVTPDSSLLVLRRATHNGAALVAIDGRHLIKVLKTFDPAGTAMLRVGDVWLSPEGVLANGSAADGMKSAVANSMLYPLEIHAGYSRKNSVFDPLHRFALWQAAIVAVSALATSLFWWFASKPRNANRVFGDALLAGEFSPYLQPLVDAQSGEWIGAEILARWKRGNQGFVSPDQFIPIAEESGFIVPLTRELTTSVARALNAVDLPLGFHVSFNVSPTQLIGGGLIEDCRRFLHILRHSDVRLVLELTERELFVLDDAMRDSLASLRSLGVSIAIDDFGTGHANLSLLNDLSVDLLKVDKSLISSVADNTVAQPVLDCVIDLAKRLNVKVIAEGIETVAQWRYLERKGVRVLQGYHFARPMSLDAFATQVGTLA
ncbi:EAL domain-containing protein [Burkholderia sp. Ch1-1]|nr:EAL domain-containing protein [Burkholderia sp. Ch1-1]